MKTQARLFLQHLPLSIQSTEQNLISYIRVKSIDFLLIKGTPRTKQLQPSIMNYLTRLNRKVSDSFV